MYGTEQTLYCGDSVPGEWYHDGEKLGVYSRSYTYQMPTLMMTENISVGEMEKMSFPLLSRCMCMVRASTFTYLAKYMHASKVCIVEVQWTLVHLDFINLTAWIIQHQFSRNSHSHNSLYAMVVDIIIGTCVCLDNKKSLPLL